MKDKTGIKAGGVSLNHKEAQGGLKVKTGKAGTLNHNEAQGGLKVKTGIKAGRLTAQPQRGAGRPEGQDRHQGRRHPAPQPQRGAGRPEGQDRHQGRRLNIEPQRGAGPQCLIHP